MKYFTKQLWIDAQEPEEAGLEADRRYEEAFAAYAQQLEGLRDRLAPDAFAFFRDGDVHDGKLIHLRVRDFDPAATEQAPTPQARTPQEIDAEAEGDTGSWYGPYRVGVELAVTEWTRTEWTLRYAHIRRIFVDYPSEQPLFSGPGGGFEDWGYHELSDAGDGFLRHEILFSSGAVVLIEFREVCVERVDRPSIPSAT